AHELTDKVAELVGIPVIASGGAGSSQHFVDLFTQTKADAGLAASIFHFGEVAIPELKEQLRKENIPIRI
ncbi:MAG: HisA/HisF-related TIM barrel protein, partial [Cyclobacteriaceae bacterium]